ncbi:MAG: hypothetical protein JWQ38_3021 [Flavipsychrobacter sp.]|nr:hypothetical protein [Flavipsychrobacter sp.]
MARVLLIVKYNYASLMEDGFKFLNMNAISFELLGITNGNIIGFTTNEGLEYRCYYYGGYNKAKGIFACYNFKSGRVEDISLSNVRSMKRI